MIFIIYIYHHRRLSRQLKGRVLTAEAIDTHNTFERPDVVRPVPFEGARLDGATLSVQLPSKSVVMLELS